MHCNFDYFGYIFENEIIDEFRFFNLVYYDFSIKKFEEKKYFIVVGSNFNEKILMMTSIKIYDATVFIKEKNKIIPDPALKNGGDPYPTFLIWYSR